MDKVFESNNETLNAVSNLVSESSNNVYCNEEEVNLILKKLNTSYFSGDFIEFISNFKLIKKISKKYKFNLITQFIQNSILEICINLLKDVLLEIYIKKEALKLLYYLSNDEEYANLFISSDIVKILFYLLGELRNKDINDIILKLLINILWSTKNYPEYIYENINFKIIIELINFFYADEGVIENLVKLEYCVISNIKEVEIVKNLVNLNYKMLTSGKCVYWNLWCLIKACNNEENALLILNLSKIGPTLSYLFNSNYVYDCLILIFNITSYTDKFIDDFNYRDLVVLLTVNDDKIQHLTADIIANLLTDPLRSELLTNKEYLIYYISVYQSSSSATKMSIIDCIYNAIHTSHRSVVSFLISRDIIDLLLNGLQFNSEECTVKCLECLLIFFLITDINSLICQSTYGYILSELELSYSDRASQCMHALKSFLT